jgi:hypothetical protein
MRAKVLHRSKPVLHSVHKFAIKHIAVDELQPAYSVRLLTGEPSLNLEYFLLRQLAATLPLTIAELSFENQTTFPNVRSFAIWFSVDVRSLISVAVDKDFRARSGFDKILEETFVN